tara:strand:- start:608 stop:1510 length:903 start_codon:yes stop_codon:yes gene_type:complete
MSSTFTNNLRLEKQGNGDNPNTWGLVLNTAVIDLVDSAITAYTTVSVDTNGTAITLTNSNGGADQARSAMIEFEGSIGNNTNVVIPSSSKIYIIKDKSVRSNTPTLKIKTAGGTGLDVAASASTLIYCDGVSVYSLNANGLGLGTASDLNFGTSINELIPVSLADIRYVTASTDSTITGAKTFTSATTYSKSVVGTPVTLTDAASIAVDFSLGNNFIVTLAGNRTLENPASASAGQTGHIYLVQDGTGSRTVAYGGSWSFQSGTIPTASTSINSVDVLVYNVRGVSAVDAVLLKAFSSSS